MTDLGLFIVDLEAFAAFFSDNSTFQIIVIILTLFGWLLPAALFLFLFFFYLEEYQESKHTASWRWVVLAIDIPALNVQTPKAVEQMFAQLAGAFDSPNLAARFREGYKQKWFSFEIVSIEGYIQFVVRTEAGLRDLVEGAVYAQYPEAEIVEIEDYTQNFPSKYPDPVYDVWAADFGLVNDDVYPIRSYTEFEHSISKDTVLKDPMGTFLESFSRIGSGEQMWFQIIVQPIDSSWKEKTIKKIKDMVGDLVGETKGGGSKIAGVFDSVLSAPLKMVEELSSQLFGTVFGTGEPAEAVSKDLNNLRYLTPGQSKILEAMEEKISKIGFKTKMRGVYIARKEVFRPERGVYALIGAINQYNIPSANSIVPTYTTSASYFFKNYKISQRKKLLMNGFKKRKIKTGGNEFILNIEELATVWHFPMSHVKTPLLQKSEGKRAEPPPGLPIEAVRGLGFDVKGENDALDLSKAEPKKFSTDAGDVSYDNNVRFG